MNEISKMMYNDIRKELEVVWQNARPYVGPKCRACRECNGINCRRIGAERSTTGARNYEKFQQIKIVYDTLYDLHYLPGGSYAVFLPFPMPLLLEYPCRAVQL